MSVLSKKVFQVMFYAVLVIAGLLLFRGMLKNELLFDDSYMFYRYAHNLLEGGTYGWNLHEKTFGCTSIPYTLSIYFLQLIGLSNYFVDYQLLAISSFCWAVLAVITLYHALKLVVKDTTLQGTITPQIVVLFVALSPLFMGNVVTCMDTSFSVFANTLIIYCLLRFPPTNGRIILLHAFVCYFAYLVRPDNGIYSVSFPLLYYVYKKYSRKQIISFAVALFIFLAIDTLIKNWYFGNPMPLPYYAKKGGFYDGFLGTRRNNPMDFFFNFFAYFGAMLLLAVLLTGKKKSFKAGLVFLIPVLLTVLYFFTVVQIMGTNSRYYIPSIPFLVAGLLFALAKTLSVPVRVTEKNLVLTGSVLVLLLFTYSFIRPPYLNYTSYREEQKAAAFIKQMPYFKLPVFDDYTSTLLKMNTFLGKLPDSATIAASEYGYIGAKHLNLKITDLCGLHNKELAFQGWNDSMLELSKPDFIWMVHTDYTGLYYKITTSPTFNDKYLFMPGVLDYGIAVRKDGALYPFIMEELSKIGIKP